MKSAKLLLGIFLFCFTAKSQTALLNVDGKSEKILTERGPNLKKFTHVFFHGGFLAPPDKDGAKIIYGSSVNLALGVRQKYKVSGVYSLGFDVLTQYTDYKLKQEEGKILPDTIINNVSGRMDYYSLGLGFYNRFNFDPHRGNFLGTFLDIGIMGDWFFSIKSISKNKLSNGIKVKSVVTNLPDLNNIGAKVYARLGFSHGALYGSYRLTDLFKSSSDYPDLPRLIVGIEIGIF